MEPNTVTAGPEDWDDLGVGAVDADWLEALFPAKAAGKRADWLVTLQQNEFDTKTELAALDTTGWDALPLPIAVKSAMRQALAVQPEGTQPPPVEQLVVAGAVAEAPAKEAAVTQLDCVVMDISGSMRARSTLDCDEMQDGRPYSGKTREDVSKVLFHTMIDKTLVFELSHAVGLLAFGERLTPVAITTEYERFHDELGRLDANQGRTKLWDAVAAAADMLTSYAATHGISDEAPRRVFVLTDGEDNASAKPAWAVAKQLQEQHVVLDAIPLAGANEVLATLCAASGGLCFDVTDGGAGARGLEQGIGLFEREATLALSRRAPREPPHGCDGDAAFQALRAVVRGSLPTREVQSAVPKAIFAKTATPAALAAKASAAERAAPAGGAGGQAACLRRVLKEFGQLSAGAAAGWQAFVSAEDALQWKAVLSDLPAPYEGGTWLLSIAFPHDYPFSPPAVRFVTPIYHCNVSVDGMICMPELQEGWSPALSIKNVLQAVRQLCEEPQADSPLDAYKGQLYRDDRPNYLAEAARHTMEHAGRPFASLAADYNLLPDDA